MSPPRPRGQRGSTFVETALTLGFLLLTALAALQLAALAEKKLRCEAAALFAVRAYARSAGQATDDILAICRHAYFAPSDEIRIDYATTETTTAATVSCTPRLFAPGYAETSDPPNSPRLLTVSATVQDPL